MRIILQNAYRPSAFPPFHTQAPPDLQDPPPYFTLQNAYRPPSLKIFSLQKSLWLWQIKLFSVYLQYQSFILLNQYMM